MSPFYAYLIIIENFIRLRVKNAHIPVAVCINSHKDCGSWVLYVERVEVKSYIFISLGRTWETSNHQNK